MTIKVKTGDCYSARSRNKAKIVLNLDNIVSYNSKVIYSDQLINFIFLTDLSSKNDGNYNWKIIYNGQILFLQFSKNFSNIIIEEINE